MGGSQSTLAVGEEEAPEGFSTFKVVGVLVPTLRRAEVVVPEPAPDIFTG